MVPGDGAHRPRARSEDRGQRRGARRRCGRRARSRVSDRGLLRARATAGDPGLKLEPEPGPGPEQVVWESADIMRRIEADFSGDAAPPLLPAAGTAERARADAMLEASGALGKAGFQMALAARNESVAEAERAARRASFEAALSDLDAQIGAGGGTFMLGAHLPYISPISPLHLPCISPSCSAPSGSTEP